MYYDERWIGGKLCWRTSPDGAWTAYTANELAHRYQAELTRASDAQRALDAEREKVKELEEGKGYLIRLWGLVASQCEILPTLVGLATQFDNYIAGQNHELATLQAQLAEIAQILCIESGKTTVDKVRDLHQSFKQVWNSYQGAGNDLFDMQAQLRQVEGLRDTARHRVDELESREIDVEILQGDLTTLRQLVEALPVVEVDGVIVWAAPDESGWFVSKRPAPTGTYWAKFKTEEDAESFLALLKYRAALTPAAGGTRHG